MCGLHHTRLASAVRRHGRASPRVTFSGRSRDRPARRELPGCQPQLVCHRPDVAADAHSTDPHRRARRRADDRQLRRLHAGLAAARRPGGLDPRRGSHARGVRAGARELGLDDPLLDALPGLAGRRPCTATSAPSMVPPQNDVIDRILGRRCRSASQLAVMGLLIAHPGGGAARHVVGLRTRAAWSTGPSAPVTFGVLSVPRFLAGLLLIVVMVNNLGLVPARRSGCASPRTSRRTSTTHSCPALTIA